MPGQGKATYAASVDMLSGKAKYTQCSLDEAIRKFVGDSVVDAVYDNHGSGSSRPDLVKRAAIVIFLRHGNNQSEERAIIHSALMDLEETGVFGFSG
jgi:ethanolamine utilization microcompartment shell protein EutL